jgi:hypothetical protein
MPIGFAIRDALTSFKRDLPKVPRAYLSQSMELVAICRMITQGAAEKEDGGMSYKDSKLQE